MDKLKALTAKLISVLRRLIGIAGDNKEATVTVVIAVVSAVILSALLPLGAKRALAEITEALPEPTDTVTYEITEDEDETAEINIGQTNKTKDRIAKAAADIERKAVKELLYLGYISEKQYDKTVALTDGEITRSVYLFTKSDSDLRLYSSSIYTMAKRIFAKSGINKVGIAEIEAEITAKYGIELELSAERNGNIIAVPYISQEGILPNGCEAVSTTMLLNYVGVKITHTDFVDNHLIKDRIYKIGDKMYGPNPYYAYAGNPYDLHGGYGCYSTVIVSSLTSVLPEGYKAVNLTGKTLAELCKTLIDEGSPVIVWGTLGMYPYANWLVWYSYDGSEAYRYPSNEHCLLLVGYDDDYYYFNDPYMTAGVIGYPKWQAESAYDSVGLQSVAVVRE